jgi:hypothetical protein
VVNVALRWGGVDEGWHGYRVDARHVTDVHVPRGHLPRAGFCKVWFPGRPPGHQPPARKCESVVHRYRTAGAMPFGPARFADALLLIGPNRRIPIDSRDVRFVDEFDDRHDERDSRKHRGRH